ncbi:hypothetical protein [Bradyrhizobium sp. USDA 4506]
MTDEEVLAAFWTTVLRDTKLPFWRGLQNGMEWAYDESFQSVVNDTRVLEDQKPAKLLDERFYVAERALRQAAAETGMISTGQKISSNDWNYTLVRGGAVAMVQSYVQTPSEMARPAKFRETMSAMNTFLSAPQFDLGDINPKVFELSAINGILIHGPVGKRFDESEQRLGFLNFAVADESYRTWGLNIPVAEVITRFEQNEAGLEAPQRDIAKPLIKRRPKKAEE